MNISILIWKNLANWSKADKKSLHFEKTEVWINKKNRLESPIKIKLSRNSLYLSKSVKCYGVEIDELLNWKSQNHDMAPKLIRVNHIFKAIYFVAFDSLMNYAPLIWDGKS